eukprot:TRINITY_DN1690_c0_g2_i1.p3 TRINITY_DN1690_c0_g2~~TRINITY_DN1690_c0_g2_i1.p3  ORF type:complete len:108 (-),score=23.09 TRINITY_DN1690_c0_g2_i1:199-522(-)
MALSRAVVLAFCLVASLNPVLIVATDEVSTNNLRGAGAAVPPSAMVEEDHSVQSAAGADENAHDDESAVDGEEGAGADSGSGGTNSSAPLPGDEGGKAPWDHVGGFR